MFCRCVDRLDHHCPAICNCVGKGNQRTYTAWLTVLLLAQMLFLHLSCLFCARVARHHWNTAGQHDRGGFTDLWPGLWLVYRLHPGKVLLIVIEVSNVYWLEVVSQPLSFCLVGFLVQCVVSERSICLTVQAMSPFLHYLQSLHTWLCQNNALRCLLTLQAAPAAL